MPEHLPELEVAVATMGRRDPDRLLDALGLADSEVPVLVVNQVPGGPLPAPVERGRVRMLSFDERGIARSRNRAIEHARADLLLFTDDDVHCLPTALSEVRAAFAAAPEAAAITFRFRDSETGAPARAYPRLPGAHTPLSVASVMSVEVAVRRSRLGAVAFDERFGLGSVYPSGEEAIFLRDLQRAGQRVRHAPVTVCEHPGQGSAEQIWDATAARAKGAVLRRMYPIGWPALVAYLAAAKYSHHGRALGPAGLVRAMLAGAADMGTART